jgi:hypothetical protein
MYAAFYAHMPWTGLPILALVLFLATFVAAVVRVCLSSRRREIDLASRLVFDAHETTHPAGSTRP